MLIGLLLTHILLKSKRWFFFHFSFSSPKIKIYPLTNNQYLIYPLEKTIHTLVSSLIINPSSWMREKKEEKKRKAQSVCCFVTSVSCLDVWFLEIGNKCVHSHLSISIIRVFLKAKNCILNTHTSTFYKHYYNHV